MDIVHHTAIGAIVMGGLAAAGHELAGAAFLMGSVAPDLDVLFMLFGRRAYLRLHQGPTHSLWLAPLLAALLSAIFLPITDTLAPLLLAALAGLLFHLLLDWLNTFGIALTWPWPRGRHASDALFFIDLPLWLLTLGTGALMLYVPSFGLMLSYLALFLAYAAGKWWLQRRVRGGTGALAAIPSSVNPFTFYLLEQAEGGLSSSLYHARSQQRSNRQFHPAPSAEAQTLAEQSQVFRDLRAVTRCLTITRVEQDADGTRIEAADLAVRNYGGKFGHTRLVFDAAGKLLHEEANI